VKKATIEAIGDRQSAGAVMSGRRWQGVVFFRPWRVQGGKIRNDMLRVLLPPRVKSSEASRDSKKVKMGVAYRFDAALYPERTNLIPSGELRGKLTRLKGINALAAADAEAAAELVVRDAVLGKLVRASRTTHFEGSLKVLGRKCELFVWGKDVEKAAALVRRLKPKLGALPKKIAARLVALANRWRPDGAREISERELASRLKPTGVSVDARARRLTFSFSSGDTFTDHGVTATLDERGTLSDVHLQ
jgi:hypothetical protein